MTIWGWLLLGAGSWVTALVLKILVDFIVQRTATVELKDWVASLLSGLWSSLCELGVAALALWYWNATFADALVMALGAALAEFTILLPAAVSANWGKKKAPSKAKEAQGWHFFFAERAVTIASHLASRALVWLSVGGTGGFAALGSAFGLFALTEGIQAYAQAKEWDWLNARTLWTFLTFMIAIVALQIALIVLWWV